MKLEVKAAKATQTAVAELNQPEKTLYYLIIGEEPHKVVINVGQKTFDKVSEIAMIETNRIVSEEENKANQKQPSKTTK